MDLTESIEAKSDQLDAIDLVSGPRTFRIERVTANSVEQPFNFHLAGFPRVWRPGKSMRRVIVAAWGTQSDAYVGQSVTLYCDPTVKFGNDITGGTRISHMTGIDKPLKVSLMVSRGKFTMHTVQPLEVAKGRDWLAELTLAGDDLEALEALGIAAGRARADEGIVAQIRSKYSAVKASAI